MTENELRNFLAGIYENHRTFVIRFREIELIALSLRQALQEHFPELEPIYARYYEAEQQSEGAQAHEAALRRIGEIIQKLKGDSNLPF